MSNLINNFPSKLTAVVHSLAKNGTHVYIARFEDGTQGVIRSSGRVYASVAQCGTLGGRTDFLFGSKAQPSMTIREKGRAIAIVQIEHLNA